MLGMSIRRSNILVAALITAMGALVWSQPGPSGAQTASQNESIANTGLSQYGPTAKAPSGGILEPRASGNNRWRYRGTLANLGNREEVVPAVTEPPVTEEGRAPLTGRMTNSNLDRRALVVKIDNVRAARPQTAINQADLVYEELVEAGFTRLAAVFHSNAPSIIGPVRSARTTDIGIAVSFDWPIFVFSGANSIVDRLVDDARVINRGAEVFTGYFRAGFRPAPHNLFTRASTMFNSVRDGNAPPAHFEYRDNTEEPAADVPTAHTVRLRFQRGDGVAIRYEWDGDLGGWRRFQNGSRHIDSFGVQVAPHNVVVQIVPYIDAGMTDKFGEDLYEAQVVGTGEGLIFTKGHVIEATWTRPTLRSVTTWTDSDGEPIELTRGRTWVALVPPGGVSFDAATCKGEISTVAGTKGDDVLKGTRERDVIAARDGNDIVLAKGGDDVVCAGPGNDRVFGGNGNDRLLGGSGADDLRGGPGNDRLVGGNGSDQLRGGADADILRGRGGVDQIYVQEEVDDVGLSTTDVMLRG